MLVLDPTPKKASLQRVLSMGKRSKGENCQNDIEKLLLGWWNEATTPKAIGKRPVG